MSQERNSHDPRPRCCIVSFGKCPPNRIKLRDPLIRPRGFGEQASHMRIARLRDAAASDTRPTGMFRRHESKIGHEFAWMPEACEVAEFRDEGDGGDERHPAQRLPRGDDRCPAPRRELPQRLCEPVDARFGFVDRVAVFLERDVLRRTRDTEIRQPPAVRQRPSFAPGIAALAAGETPSAGTSPACRR